MKYLFAVFFLLAFTACAHQEPIDLSLLNNEALDLSKQFDSESAASSSGLRTFSSQTGSSGCATCAH